MPPRWLCWLIVMFWLTTTGWLFWRDLWPTWRPGEPPPFHIDDVNEVQKSGNPQRTYWTVERGKVGQTHLDKVFRASTWVDYHKEEDTYSLYASLEATKSLKLKPLYLANVFKIKLMIKQMTSEYRITRAGRLHSLQAEVKAIPQSNRPENALSPKQLCLRIWGEVRGEHFFGHCRVSADYLNKPIQFDLPPTAVSYTGSVLMPLHPVNQISGLHPGQQWRQPLVDPLRDALPGLSGGVRSLNARVLPQAEMLTRGTSETSCLVIEYTDDDNKRMGRTWVEQSSNRVLQQEAILEDVRWIMKRDLERRGSNRSPAPPTHDRGTNHD